MSTPTPAKPGASSPAAGDSASALVEQGVEAVTRLRRVLEEATATRWLKLELTLSQLKTVFTLDRMERVTISELAQHLGVGSAATSVLVDRLVRLKLAGRTEDPADRRRTFVSLTSRGRDLVAELRHGGREGLRQRLRCQHRQGHDGRYLCSHRGFVRNCSGRSIATQANLFTCPARRRVRTRTAANAATAARVAGEGTCRRRLPR